MDEKAAYRTMLYKLDNALSRLRQNVGTINHAIDCAGDAITINSYHYKRGDLERMRDEINSQINNISNYYIPEIRNKIASLSEE